MNTGISFEEENLIFHFVDESNAIKDLAKQRFRPEIIKDQFHINFEQMLEREWGLESHEINSSDRSHNRHGNVVIFEKKGKVASPFDKETQEASTMMETKLFNVGTIFESSQPIDSLDQFLTSFCFLNTIRFFVLLFILGISLTDYSFRLAGDKKLSLPISSRNIISLHFQLLANCAFTVQIVLRMFSQQKFFINPWKYLNLVGTIGCWIWISMDFMEQDDNSLFQVLTVIKVLLAFRVIELFELIRNPFEDFITTIPDLGKIFFPLLIFMSFYSILGLIIFSGANEFKCRETAEPIAKKWPEVSTNLCGSESFQCSQGFCGNPYDFNLPYNTTERYEYGNQFGLVSFDHIGSSFLTTYHYVFLSNWTSIKYKFSRFLTPYLTTFYFFTLALFLFFIMANLNMITICKAYIEKEKKREKFNQNKPEPLQHPDLEESMSNRKRKLYRFLEICDLALVFISAVFIVIDYEGITLKTKQLMGFSDFIITWVCLFFLILKTITLGREFFAANFILLDWVTVLLSVGDLIYCLAIDQEAFYPVQDIHILLRSLKFYRIIKILYFSKSWFKYEKNILGIFAETINTMKFFFLLLFCIMLIASFVGQNLFAFRIRFHPTTKRVDIESGQPYVSNFESIYKSLVSMMFLLENERWTETMYRYYSAVGWKAVIFFAIVVFVIHLMLARLFIAIFLCYFRRNLEKKHSPDEASQVEKDSGKEASERASGEKEKEEINEYLEEREEENQTSHERENSKKSKEGQKIFWFFNRNSCICQILRALYHSDIFQKTMIAMLLLHCLTIILRTNHDEDKKTEILDAIELIPLSFYIFEVVIGVLSKGFLFGEKTYLKESKLNFLNILVVLLVILSHSGMFGELTSNIMRRFAIVKIFTPFSKVNKQTEIILKAISSIAQSFGRIYLMYMFLLLLPSLLPLKLQSKELYKCMNYHSFSDEVPDSMQECTIAGGDWINDSQAFNNIFESLALMYQMVTSESWTYYIENFNQQHPWDAYFVLNFFIFNTCLLNIFVGLIVETYLGLKEEAYKLNLLRPSQRGWILIKNSINELVPIPSMKEPDEKSNKLQKLAFNIISQSIYQNFIDILPYISVVFYSMRYYRAEPSYLATLSSINVAIIAIFCIDTLMKLQLKMDYFYLDNCKIELAGFIFFILYGIVASAFRLSHDASLTFQFFAAILVILRCKKLIFRYTWSKTLINSVIDVLPKCIRIGIILAVVLFFYVSVGMEVFRNVKPTSKSDGYTTGFNDAFTSLMTLLKIVSNESWFDQVSAFVRGPTSADYCFEIHTIHDVRAHPNMGCGSPAAYLFFISFHVIMALLILNLLIATMTAAYDENYEKEYKSVNIFQLQDTLKLWQKYDPRGTGVIPYKKFWRLSSEIAILFGISKKKLIKGKQKFMQELDIQICQSIETSETSVLCYKFHDVIMKFSKIKLKVSKGEANEESGDTMDFQIHPMIEREIKDYITETPPIYQNIRLYKNFKSGEMKYFFGLLRKLRAWRIVAKKKDSSVISKLSHIIKVALEKKKNEEMEINKIRKSMHSKLLSPVI